MGTTVNAAQVAAADPAVAKSVLEKLDARYMSNEIFKGFLANQERIVEQLTAAAQKQQEDSNKLFQQIIELKTAPAFHPAKRSDGKEYSLGRLVYAYVHKRISGEWPTEMRYGREVEYVKKALSVGTTTSGGFLVPEEWATTILEELKARAVVLAAGPTIIPFSGKKLHLGGFNADATAQWLGENVASTESTPTTREVVLDLQTARIYSVGSIEFFREGTPQADAALQANLARAMARFVDKGFLEGSGANRPTGMRTVTGINATGAAANGANGGTLVYGDLAQTLFLLQEDDVPTDGLAWFMHPRTANVIRKMADANNLPLWIDHRAQGDPPSIFGYSVFLSSQISVAETKGTLTTASYLLLVRMPDIFIGQGVGEGAIELAVSEHAEFKAAGIAIRVMARTDLQPRDPVVIAVCDGIAA